jgi:hypothetical protein
MPEENVTRRRHVLLVDVTQSASEVSRLVREARDLSLPVEPGVRPGRDALVRSAVLLGRACRPGVVSGPSSQPDASGPVIWRGRLAEGPGSSGCEDLARRYDLYQGRKGKRGTYSGRRGGPGPPPRGRSGRTSSAAPST